jgi:hypothetical protein
LAAGSAITSIPHTLIPSVTPHALDCVFYELNFVPFSRLSLMCWLLLCCRVEVLEARFHAAWEQQLAAYGPDKASLFAACRASVGHLFLGALPYKLINDAAQFVGPLILNRLLSVVAAKAAAASGGNGSSSSSSSGWGGAVADWLAALGLDDPLGNGYTLSLLMFVGTLLGVLADNQVGCVSYRYQSHARKQPCAACWILCKALYALRQSSASDRHRP